MIKGEVIIISGPTVQLTVWLKHKISLKYYDT